MLQWRNIHSDPIFKKDNKSINNSFNSKKKGKQLKIIFAYRNHANVLNEILYVLSGDIRR